MKKSKFLTEFKQFAMRGNVVDMAVGIIAVRTPGFTGAHQARPHPAAHALL